MNISLTPLQKSNTLIPDFIQAIPVCRDQSLAIFDADGTLWTNDVADDFTLWMIQYSRISGKKWSHYLNIYREDPPTGCAFLLSLYQGLGMTELQHCIETYWHYHANRQWIPEVLDVLFHLAEKHYTIWVVSGTPTVFLLPLLKLLPVNNILGMDFEINDKDEQHQITGRVRGIPCAGDGKAEKILQTAQGRRIYFCAGNSTLDEAMMNLANISWCIYPDAAFAKMCREKHWPILERPTDFQEELKLM